MHCTYASDWMDVFLGLLWAERRRQHEAWEVHAFRVEYGEG